MAGASSEKGEVPCGLAQTLRPRTSAQAQSQPI